MPKGTIPLVDQYLDETALALDDILGGLRAVQDGRDALIVAAAPMIRGAAIGDPTGAQALVDAVALIASGLHVAAAGIGEARTHVHELRETPAIRRVRKQARQENEERRQRERRMVRVWQPGEVAA